MFAGCTLDVNDRMSRELARSLDPLHPPTVASPDRVVTLSPQPNPFPAPDLLPLLADAAGLPVRHWPADKTLWEIHVEVEGVWCAVALRKFGLRVMVDADASDAEAVAATVVRRLRRALTVLERRELDDFAQRQFAASEVLMANQYGRLKGIYDVLRRQARDAFEKTPEDIRRELDEAGDTTLVAGMLAGMMGTGFAGTANAVAAIGAWYSAFEHLLVLLAPFVGWEPGRVPLPDLVAMSWRDKFKTLFDLSSTDGAHRYYTRLVETADAYRNPFAHGVLDKNAGLFYVAVPGYRAVPVTLSNVRDAPHVALEWGEPETFEVLDRSFDDVEAWLRSDVARHGMMWAEGGLHVAFHAESRRRYADAIASGDEAFEELLIEISTLQDRLDNAEGP